MSLKAFLVAACALLAGCGLETAGSAATGGNIKAREAEEAKKAQQRAEQRIGEAAQQLQRRADPQGDAERK